MTIGLRGGPASCRKPFSPGERFVVDSELVRATHILWSGGKDKKHENAGNKHDTKVPYQ